MSKRTLLMVVSIVASLALAATGTLAYLSDSDMDTNVMVLGNVDILQNEQERTEDGELDQFTQNKPLYPAVYEGSTIPWADPSDWVVENDEAWKVVEANDNVLDKFVTVSNTGKSEAYIRTIIAYEGDETYGPEGDYIHVVDNGANVDPAIAVELLGTVTIDGTDYTVYSYTYPEALPAGETSVPSLKQLYLDKTADNDVVAEYGDTYDVLVLSQAVQTNGFHDAKTALDSAFGAVTAENVADWFATTETGSPGDENDTNNPPVMGDLWDGTAATGWYNDTAAEFTLDTAEELAGLAQLVNSGNSFTGKTIKLDENVDLAGKEWTPIGNSAKPFSGTFDGQGNTVLNLTINNEGGVEQALFGCGANATITGINVKNVEINAYSEAASIVGYAVGTTISDCHLSGDINIVTEWAYVGGIAGHGYMNIENCSVIASGTGVIKSETRNAVGGICAWLWEDGHHITGCEVANLEITGWANVGGVTGFIHRNNELSNCTVDNVVLTKTRIGGNPTIGLAAGGYSYNASKPITMTNNSFSNITLNGESKEFAHYNILHGSEYDGNDNANFILSNNSQSGITDNTTVYVP